MQTQSYQIQVNGIGTANILTISQAHSSLGITKRECVERILTSPSILKSDLKLEQAKRIQHALTQFKLPCEIVDSHTTIPPTDQSFEVACYIQDFTHVTEFAAEVAAFLGQSSEEMIASLTQIPAVLIGHISQQIAQEFIERFQKPGIELIASATNSARYSAIAFMPSFSNSIKSHYLRLGLAPQTNDPHCTQWIANDLALNQAESIWKKASELHLPVSIQNHDYLRFDLSLTKLAADVDRAVLSDWLLDRCEIPKQVHPTLFKRLPIIIQKCLPLESSKAMMEELQQLNCDAEAIAIQSSRFDIELNQLQPSHMSALGNLLKTIMRRVIAIPEAKAGQLTLNLSANQHQALWIIHEVQKSGIKARLIKTTDVGATH
ncbi:hypothetical protein ACMXYX_15750 [Neptuniibacter sp. QD72_48]|uniref:hypothetical protein n=1 Tax=Neptuniibacter sp. QD72_48 TaxID=3398214 RepID=UPI0039F4F6D1